MDILIEESDGGLWVAALKKGKLDGLEVDPIGEEVRWGSIYRARVKTINKAIDAAFLDLDGFNTGLLYNRDVRYINDKGKWVKGGDKAIGKMFQPGDMVTVQAKSAYIPPEFTDDLRPEAKVAGVSMDITLQGRYLIYCPLMTENQISMRIRDKELRKQLTAMLDDMEGTHGCILRSAAAGTQTDILRREEEILAAVWDNVELFIDDEEVGMIMLGPDSVQRSLSDQANHQINRIEITTMEHFHHAEDWCQVFAPDLVTKIEPVQLDNATDDLALFHERDIMGQIEALFQAYAILPGGGNIIIQDTAALTAVDVNKSSDTQGNLAINIEATQEIARQIRLRNTGGIIVVDFLRLSNKKDEDKLIAALKDAIAQDPCTVQINGKTPLGLYELTRNRRTPPLSERIIQQDLD